MLPPLSLVLLFFLLAVQTPSLLAAPLVQTPAPPPQLLSQAVPVINPSFEFPVTFQFAGSIEAWQTAGPVSASPGAGVYRFPPSAYPRGVPVR
jgi:hypothetical protein